MAQYEIVFARSARKELQALAHTVAERILEKVELLASNPRPSGCQKLRGHSSLWRNGSVSTELFTALTMTSESSMYQLSGIEVKHTVKDIFLLTLRLG